MFLQPGSYVSSYCILAEIGQGGMAAVYKAYHAPTDRYVAIKVLPPHFAADPKFTRRFLNEARLISSLEHAHIVPVHDYGEENGLPYIVMRYLQAGTLKEILSRSALPLSDITHIITQVGSALDYAHRQNVVHRDVKPSNILIDHESDCYLADFGIAKMVEDAVEHTATGMIGTPAYMSPEQADGKAVDGRTDIYSLGVVLYEMVSGSVPFRADTPIALVHKHLNEPVPLLREIDPAIPEPIEQVVMTALHKDPAARYQRMSEMITALQVAAGSEWSPTSLANTAADVAYEIAAGHSHTAVTFDAVFESEAKLRQTKVRQGVSWWMIASAVLGVAALTMIGLLLGGVIGPKTAGGTPATATSGVQAAADAPTIAVIPTQTPTPTAGPSPTPLPFYWQRVTGIDLPFPMAQITDVVADPLDRMVAYAATDGLGIYKTTNGGESWAPVGAGTADLPTISNPSLPSSDTRSSIQAQVSGSDTRYRGSFCKTGQGDGGLERSSDGQTWEKLTGLEMLVTGELDGIRQIIIDPIHPNIVYALALSIDHPRPDGDTRCLYNIIPHDEASVATIRWHDTIALSTDGGDTWQRMQASGGNTASIEEMVINPEDGTLYSLILVVGSGPEPGIATADYWGIERYAPGQITRVIGSVVPMSASTNIGGVRRVRSNRLADQFYLYFKDYSGQVSSGDIRLVLGAHAANPGVEMDVSTGSGQAYGYLQLRLNPLNPDILYAALSDAHDFTGNYISANGGVTWSIDNSARYIKSNLAFRPGESAPYVLTVRPTQARTAGGGNPILTELRGTGELLTKGAAIPVEADSGALWAHPSEPGTFLLASVWYYGKNGPACDSSVVYRTIDSGQTWNKIGVPGAKCGEGVVIVSDVHGEVVYTFEKGSAGFLRSDDGGVSWTSKALPDSLHFPPVVNPDNGLELWAVISSGISHTADGGDTWEVVSELQPTGLAIGASIPPMLYAVTQDGLSISFDGGVAWGVVRQGLAASPIVYSVVVHPSDPTRVFIATPDGIFRLVAQRQ